MPYLTEEQIKVEKELRKERAIHTAARAILGLFVGGTTFTLLYLLGAFWQASFDIAEWDGIVRGIVAVFGGVLALAITAGITIDPS